MKMITLIKVILVVLVAMLAGCAHEQSSTIPTQEVTKQTEVEQSLNNYQILEFSFSDAISGAAHSVEYTYWNDKNLVEPNEKTVTVNLGNMQVTGNYDQSQKRDSNNFVTHEYDIPQIGTFEIDENGILTRFHLLSTSNQHDAKELSQEECQKIAEQFMQSYVDVEQYRVEGSYSETFEEYEFWFTKYIGEHRTADEAVVSVTKTGVVISFKSFMLGRVPISTEVDYDYQEIEKEVFSKLEGIYADVKQYCDDIYYETAAHQVTILENGEIGLLYYVDVTCAYDWDGDQLGVTERVGLVVTKND
jgi:hypothetical protein